MAGMKKQIWFLSVFVLIVNAACFAADVQAAPPPKSIKILAIGNSFSVDGLEHVYSIATNAGIQDVVLGNLVIGGCSLSTHWNNARTDAPNYNYRKNSSGGWVDRKKSTMETGIQDEDWDVITIQQVSHCSGQPETYNSDLDNLVAYISSRKTNPNARLGWQMTWAYQADSKHSQFSKYDRDQLTMYNAIVKAVSEKIASNEAFDAIIPTATAIQNMRTSPVGDTLTRDGFHLSQNLGRYIAGMTWVKALTGLSIDNITWVPSSNEIPDDLLPVIKEAVNHAGQTPFAITKSSY